jgi:site-specific DNA-methyltransferase (adenine-specific)
MIIHGDSFEELKKLEDCSIDSLVTDPPYGLSSISSKVFNECMLKWCTDDDSYIPSVKGFMGKSWDSFVPPPALWKEVYRVLKPGAHGLVFAGSRTQDIMGLSLRLAGFELRDCITWLYGSGFPKSHDISKAIESHTINGSSNPKDFKKLKGKPTGKKINLGLKKNAYDVGARKEIYLHNEIKKVELTTQEAKQWSGWGTALKPAYEPALLVRKPFKGSVAQNVLEHGTGGINIDGCRIGKTGGTIKDRKTTEADSVNCYGVGLNGSWAKAINKGRFPSNVLMDDKASDMLENQARFFYTAKASPAERSAGLDGINLHPTVKPIEIMRYLARLITPPGGTILEPFLGSGTTAIAALKENFNIIGIEREAEYVDIARARLAYWAKHDHAMTKQNPPPVVEQLELGF